MRPRSPCNQPGCPGIAVNRGRCQAHQVLLKQWDRERHRAYDAQRPSSSARGYGSAEWKKRRAEALAVAGGICQLCQVRAAVEVHHVRAQKVTPGSRAFAGDVTPLVATCRSCHNRLTARGL